MRAFPRPKGRYVDPRSRRSVCDCRAHRCHFYADMVGAAQTLIAFKASLAEFGASKRLNYSPLRGRFARYRVHAEPQGTTLPSWARHELRWLFEDRS